MLPILISATRHRDKQVAAGLFSVQPAPRVQGTSRQIIRGVQRQARATKPERVPVFLIGKVVVVLSVIRTPLKNLSFSARNHRFGLGRLGTTGRQSPFRLSLSLARAFSSSFFVYATVLLPFHLCISKEFGQTHLYKTNLRPSSRSIKLSSPSLIASIHLPI